MATKLLITVKFKKKKKDSGSNTLKLTRLTEVSNNIIPSHLKVYKGKKVKIPLMYIIIIEYCTQFYFKCKGLFVSFFISFFLY